MGRPHAVGAACRRAVEGKDSPRYGIVKIAARTLTDKGTRVVTIARRA